MPEQQPSYTTHSLYHGWLPRHPEIHKAFVKHHLVATRPGTGKTYDPQNPHVKAFIDAIRESAVMKPLSDAMFEQRKIYSPKWEEEADHQVVSLDHLAAILDSIVISGPKFWKLKNAEGKVIGEAIGVPIFLALDLLTNTTAGYDLFRWKDFNAEMKKLLNGWNTDVLETEKSAEVFTDKDEGWFCKEGLELLEEGLRGARFDDTYANDGFPIPRRYKTWDSFFTRKFKDVNPPLRPIETLRRNGKDIPVINNACESTSLRIAQNVQLQDQFWLKGQNYSLYDMLGSLAADHAEDFKGGTVYQAFPSPKDYHGWHSPIKGKLVATAGVDGTYYAVLPDDGSLGDDGLEKGDPHGAIIRSQGWLTVSAARYIYIIETDDNEDIAKVAFIAIGMGEVSSCRPRPDLADIPLKNPIVNVKAGDELGMFHFGGSTYVVIIQLRDPQRKQLVFKDINDIPITPGQHRWINSVIARVEDVPEE